MLGIKNENTQLELRFKDKEDVDVEIIRSAKELDLKVKTAKFNKKVIEKLSVPVIARFGTVTSIQFPFGSIFAAQTGTIIFPLTVAISMFAGPAVLNPFPMIRMYCAKGCSVFL